VSFEIKTALPAEDSWDNLDIKEISVDTAAAPAKF
jgi:hypothetical protein